MYLQILSSPYSHASNTRNRAFPLSVREYSTYGGTSLNCILFINSFSSKSFDVEVNMVLVIPIIVLFNSLTLALSILDNSNNTLTVHFPWNSFKVL